MTSTAATHNNEGEALMRQLPQGSYSNPDFFDHGLPPPHLLFDPDDPYASAQTLSIHSDSTPRASVASGANIMSTPAAPYTNIDAPYSSAYNSSQWLEKEQARSRRSKWIVIGSLLTLAGLIAVGVAVGVTVSKHKSSSSSSSLASSSSSSSSSGSSSSSSDPSVFTKDDALKQSFYGIAYTPEGSQYPACGNSLDDIITDIQLLSQLTTRIRLYGADCNQSALVLDAITQTKVNMTVWLANYPVATDAAPYVRQRDAIKEAIQTFGTDHVGGVTVGNEFILNYVTAAGVSDPNSAAGNEGAALLIANITDTRSMISDLNLDKTIPIGMADAGGYFNNEVLAAVDYAMANVHPWFASVTIEEAATWTWDFFQENDIAAGAALSNNPAMYIAETGWPTQSNDTATASDGPSLASEDNLQIFMDTFVCQANNNGTGYFFFEYFDEEWKLEEFGGVEGYWGLFHQNRTLKRITIPEC